MSLPLSLAVFFTTWWVVLFAVLPWGVRSQAEAPDVKIAAGSDKGAPVAPHLGLKLLITTLVAAVVFAAIDAYVILEG